MSSFHAEYTSLSLPSPAGLHVTLYWRSETIDRMEMGWRLSLSGDSKPGIEGEIVSDSKIRAPVMGVLLRCIQ